jgi:hypothetical protein
MSIDLRHMVWYRRRMEKPQMYYNRKGKPITLESWIKRSNNKNYCIIKQEDLANGQLHIITVWVGLDHSWGFGPKRLIFETTVFARGKSKAKGNIVETLLHFKELKEVACLQSSTEEEALEDYAQLLKEWENK